MTGRKGERTSTESLDYILLTISILFSLFLLETGLRMFTRFPIGEDDNKKSHPRLSYTVKPSLTDIDQNGFRNPGRYKGEKIVGIGDSHTYGSNASWDKSWPHQLEKLLERSVYNYGVGSYNIYQYYWLVKKALERDVDSVVVGLYPTNDFKSGTCEVLNLPSWKSTIDKLHLDTSACPKREKNKKKTKNTWIRIRNTVKKTAIIDSVNYFFWKPIFKPWWDRIRGEGRKTYRFEGPGKSYEV